MPGQSSENNSTHKRSLGIALGVTEFLFLVGLVLLATGVSLEFSIPYGLMAGGVVMIVAAFYNAAQG